MVKLEHNLFGFKAKKVLFQSKIFQALLYMFWKINTFKHFDSLQHTVGSVLQSVTCTQYLKNVSDVVEYLRQVHVLPKCPSPLGW